MGQDVDDEWSVLRHPARLLAGTTDERLRDLRSTDMLRQGQHTGQHTGLVPMIPIQVSVMPYRETRLHRPSLFIITSRIHTPLY